MQSLAPSRRNPLRTKPSTPQKRKTAKRKVKQMHRAIASLFAKPKRIAASALAMPSAPADPMASVLASLGVSVGSVRRV